MKATVSDKPRSEPLDDVPDRDRSGDVLGDKYTLIALLGRGGMGSVYEATHRNGRRVAVKILAPELTANTEVRRRFLREGYAANAVDHPRVVQVLDDDVAEDGSIFLVMELLRGEGLKQRAARSGGTLDERFVLRVADELLDVLASAHEKGIVHRDLKPDNLFWNDAIGLKVLDFGIARFRSGGHVTAGTKLGMILGSPGFMAPEQALGEIGDIDARSDLWAVSATMFFLLTGELVHQAETVEAVLARTAMCASRSLRSVAPRISEATAAVVDGGLARARQDRWQDAATMRAAVARALALAPPERSALERGGARTSIGLAPTASSRPPESRALGPSRAQQQEAEQPSTTSVPAISSVVEPLLPRRLTLHPLTAAAGATLVGLLAVLGLRALDASSRDRAGAGELSAPNSPRVTTPVQAAPPRAEEVTPTALTVPAASPASNVDPPIPPPSAAAPRTPAPLPRAARPQATPAPMPNGPDAGASASVPPASAEPPKPPPPPPTSGAADPFERP